MRRALALLLALTSPAHAGQAILSWVAPTHNVDGTPYTNPGGYRLYWRCVSPTVADVRIADVPHTVTTYTQTAVPDDGRTCYYSATAYNALGAESARTNEVSKTFAAAPVAAPRPPALNDVTWTRSAGVPNSIRVDSSTDRVKRTANLPATTAFTFAAWVRVHNDRTGNFRSVINIADAESGATAAFNVMWTDTNAFVVWNNSSEVAFSSNPPVNGTWFYVALYSSGSGNLQGRWRGLWDTSWATVNTTGASYSPAVYELGNSAYSDWSGIDIVYPRIWGAALTDTELFSEMNSVTPVRTANLNHASVDDGDDVSGNNYDLTLTNTSTGASGPLSSAIALVSTPLRW
jgi:hypothetical protein